MRTFVGLLLVIALSLPFNHPAHGQTPAAGAAG